MTDKEPEGMDPGLPEPSPDTVPDWVGSIALALGEVLAEQFATLIAETTECLAALTTHASPRLREIYAEALALANGKTDLQGTALSDDELMFVAVAQAVALAGSARRIVIDAAARRSSNAGEPSPLRASTN